MRRIRLETRRAIGLEWAVTKVRNFTPPNPSEIPAHGTLIWNKLEQKGFRLTGKDVDFSPFLIEVLKKMMSTKVVDLGAGSAPFSFGAPTAPPATAAQPAVSAPPAASAQPATVAPAAGSVPPAGSA